MVYGSFGSFGWVEIRSSGTESGRSRYADGCNDGPDHFRSVSKQTTPIGPV